MRKYEAMFIFRPDLNDNEKKEMFDQVTNTLNKFDAKINDANIWAEKRKLHFNLAIKGNPTKFREGLYYLIEFESQPSQIEKINAAYRLNENIMRFLISVKGDE